MLFSPPLSATTVSGAPMLARRVCHGQRRFVHIKVVMVEDVESFCTELEFHPFRKREGFAYRQVGIPCSGPTERACLDAVFETRVCGGL